MTRCAEVSMCLSFLLSCVAAPSIAADWGYDGSEAPPPPAPKVIEEQSAASLTKSLIKPSKNAAAPAAAVKKSAVGTAKSKEESNVTKVGVKVPTAPVPLTVPLSNAVKSAKMVPMGAGDSYLDKDGQAARCWLQLFQACSKQPLEFVEQKRMESYVLGRERQGGKGQEEFRSILLFWPKLISDLHERPEMEMHYADLFKALLRLHEHNSPEKTQVEGSTFTSDADLITELLGLQRTAVEGDPPFTEDAVNAYADMAVFIYEQQHAGRTIDANDNRTLFAKVVVEKFNRAPSDAARRAMASFDLAWAKFKIAWFSSNETTRQTLLSKLVGSGAASSLSVTKDPLLDLVLTNWPWKNTP